MKSNLTKSIIHATSILDFDDEQDAGHEAGSRWGICEHELTVVNGNDEHRWDGVWGADDTDTPQSLIMSGDNLINDENANTESNEWHWHLPYLVLPIHSVGVCIIHSAHFKSHYNIINYFDKFQIWKVIMMNKELISLWLNYKIKINLFNSKAFSYTILFMENICYFIMIN